MSTLWLLLMYISFPAATHTIQLPKQLAQQISSPANRWFNTHTKKKIQKLGHIRDKKKKKEQQKWEQGNA